MSLPALTGHAGLRTTRPEAGLASLAPRGLTPQAPFCVRAQWYLGDTAVGNAGCAEATEVRHIAAARRDAEREARRRNPGFNEANGYSLSTHTLDRDSARDRAAYLRCQQLAGVANIGNLGFGAF